MMSGTSGCVDGSGLEDFSLDSSEEDSSESMKNFPSLDSPVWVFTLEDVFLNNTSLMFYSMHTHVSSLEITCVLESNCLS